MALRLRVVTPTRMVVDADVVDLTAPGSEGQLGILPLHVTFLGQLDIGVLQYTESGVTKRLVVHGGYAEVIDDVVTILADDAEFPEEIDVDGAKADLARISSEIAAEQESTDRVTTLLAQQKKAQVRLDTAGTTR